MTLSPRHTLLATLVIVVTMARPVPAQTLGAARAAETVVANDLFLLRGGGAPPDYDFTHGTRVGVAWSSAPRWIARAARADASCRTAESRAAGCLASSVRLAQDIYTPRRDGVLPVAGERPYAGWLGVTASLRRIAPSVTRTLALDAGVTGRPSLAENAQMDVHHLVRTGPQLGWGHQLAARATLGARYGETRRFERPSAGTKSLAAHLAWDATAGNALTAISAGGDVQLSSRSGAPWSPAAPDAAHPPRFFVRLGLRADALLRSALVEGWRAGEAAELRHVVAQGEVTTGARWRRYALEYRATMRGPEYRAAPGAHPYGSFRLTVDGY